MRKEKMRMILMVLLAAAFLISAGMMIRQQIQYRKIDAGNEEAARLAGLQKGAGSQQPASSVPFVEMDGRNLLTEFLPGEAFGLVGIDLDALRAVNRDVMGWIAIPGTTLSCPLVQGEDNQFYLSHDWKGEASAGGSVFLESTSDPDLTGFHTLVYAHRMHSGAMFGALKYYKKTDYWLEHPSVYIVLDDTVYRYDIFSAQETGVKGIAFRLDMEENHLEGEFLQYCMDHSVIDTGSTPDAGSRFLTLSTCTGAGYANRWVIHGVLAQEYSRG